MDIDQIMTELYSHSEDELHELNRRLVSLIKQKRAQRTAAAFGEFNVGDKVRFNSHTTPRQWIGKEGTVTGKRRTKLTVSVDDGPDMVVPPTLLEAVG